MEDSWVDARGRNLQKLHDDSPCKFFLSSFFFFLFFLQFNHILLNFSPYAIGPCRREAGDSQES